jgi:hypothetical protein
MVGITYRRRFRDGWTKPDVLVEVRGDWLQAIEPSGGFGRD